MRRIANQGFTLIELMVVVTMIAALMGAVTTSVSKARTRAKVSQATVECREITNAILAYENYNKNHSLEEHIMEEQDAERGKLGFILGTGEQNANGEKIPVLYNAAMVNEKYIVDPWGRPYRVTIRKATGLANPDQVDSAARSMKMTVFAPNFTRLSPGERGL